MVNELDCDHKVCEFKLQSLYYIHFWTYTFRKSNPRYGINNTTNVLLKV